MPYMSLIEHNKKNRKNIFKISYLFGEDKTQSKKEAKKQKTKMALRMWASSTASALKLSSSVSKSQLTPAFSISRCFSSGDCDYVYSCVLHSFCHKLLIGFSF